MKKQAMALNTTESAPLEHYSVMHREVLEFLSPQAGAQILDGTIGGAGHGAALLAGVGASGCLWGIERDPRTLERARKKLAATGNPFELIHGNFADLEHWWQVHNIPPLDGILLDLGTSIFQLKEAERGFSLRADGPLDMRMNPQEDGPNAADLVNTWSEQELKRVFKEYGEERFAGRIARWIVEARREQPFTRTLELADLIASRISQRNRIHPATRIFQALRIAVNQEYQAIEKVLPVAVRMLKPGGKIAVISFHSGEDRRVKTIFRELAKDCVCPPRQPVCTCDTHPFLGRKSRAHSPTDEEVAENPPSRSARLRTACRIEHPTDN